VQPFVDAEGVVQVRVVDQSLPAHGGARLLEIHPHHDEQAVGHPVGQRAQAPGIVHGGVDIVDGAGSDHDHQTMILAVENALHRLASAHHGGGSGGGHGQIPLQVVRRQQDLLGMHIEVFKGFFDHLTRYSRPPRGCDSGIRAANSTVIPVTTG